jgi:hypothetical protein
MNTIPRPCSYRQTDVGQVGRLDSAALMMKTQIGLGVLSIPAVFNSLGMIPGMICLLAIATITTWSDYMVGTFKLRHPEVYGIDDVGQLLFGRIGKEIMGVAYVLCKWVPLRGFGPSKLTRRQDWIFVAGSGMLSISITLNALSLHGSFTAVCVAVAAIIGFIFCSIQTLGRITWLARIGVICIVSASEFPRRLTGVCGPANNLQS